MPSVRIDTNIAALRAETTATNGDVAIVEGYYSAGDGGGGDFYWDAGSSELENGGTIIEVNTHPATGRWKRRFSGPIHAKWFGVKADCVRVYDGSVSPNSNVLTSVTAGFTSAAVDNGKTVLLTAPFVKGTGTLTTTLNSEIVTGGTGGNSTDFQTDFGPKIGGGLGGGEPTLGGCFWIEGFSGGVNGTGFMVASIFDPPPPPTPQTLVCAKKAKQAVSNKNWYKTVQVRTTATYSNATQITLGVTFPATLVLPVSDLEFVYGSDDTAALTAAINATIAGHYGKIVLPAGRIGTTSNILLTGVNGLTIEGEAGGKTIIDRLNLATDETPYPNAAGSYGRLSFQNCKNMEIRRIAYNGSVPVYGMVHSAGGSPNNSGSNSGFYVSGGNIGDSDDILFEEINSDGWGSRDEFIISAGHTENWTIRNCHAVNTNNVAINPGFAATGGAGLRIENCSGHSFLVSSTHYQMIGCEVVGGPNSTTGAMDGQVPSLQLATAGNGLVSDCRVHGFDSSRYTVSAIIVGVADAGSSLVLNNCKIYDVKGLFSQGTGAPLSISDHWGTIIVSDFVVEGVDSLYANQDARCIYVTGANTGRVHIASATLQGSAQTTIASGSDGVLLSAATTINVVSTSGFPTSGTLRVKTTNGYESATYTAITPPTSFTGVTSVGTGTMSTNNPIALSDVTVGIEVDASVPAGHVTVSPNVKYGASIGKRLKLGSPLASFPEITSISSTGVAPTLNEGCDYAIITANGSVTVTLPDPTRIPGHPIALKNADSQLGTTTISTVAGSIDGPSALVGPSISCEYVSDGVKWRGMTPVVTQLTGTSNQVTMASTSTYLQWPSSGPTIADVSGQLQLKVNSSYVIFDDGANRVASWSWNGGSPFLQFGPGATTCQILANAGTGQSLIIKVAGTSPGSLSHHCDTILFGNSAGTERGRIDSNGLHTKAGLRINESGGANAVMNASGSALATSATGGFTYLPTCAGTPTGTPTSFTGCAPMVVDTTGSKLWVRIGGTWKSTALA